MTDFIKVFGHKNPDTDTVVSAIAYAWYLTEVKGTPAQAYILGDLNKETQYVLTTFDVAIPTKLEKLHNHDKIVIVDTNNPDELPDNLSNAELLEIIDHHKLTGGITTTTPVSITMRPMASTSSLIYTIANPELHQPSPAIAGLLLSGILSDTLKFRSPTTTAEDVEIAQHLAEISNTDIEAHSAAMFANKSDISDLIIEDIVLMDSKVFEIRNNQKARLSVLETTSPENALNIKNDIKATMLSIKEKENLNNILFYIVDIINENSILIVADEATKKLASEAYGIEFLDDMVILSNMMSRKKQFLPPLM